jgi:tRNA G18 (ribose-2'-O)-methylase SpoU
MDTFGFTKKKLTSLSPETRHKHMVRHLTGFYQRLTTNRVNPASLDLFARQYNQILNWAKMTPFARPGSDHTRLWIEAISDRIHYHRGATGAAVRDHDLTVRVHTRDQPDHGANDTPGAASPRSQRPALPSGRRCHVALDGLRSLFNVGSIFRTCEAAGFGSIILGNVPGKEHPGVQKTAMGAQEWMDQETTDDLAKTLLEKKETGFHIIGVETVKNARPFYDMPWQGDIILVFGNEEYGISSHVLSACDEVVYIPMFGRKNSINVANAVAVVCFHVAWARGRT